MNYNFDLMTTRRGSHCVKWDECADSEIIPLWVADMDFEVAPAITEALRRRVEHKIFGYAIVEDSYYDAVINWYSRRHHWDIKREWIVYTTGVVPAVSAVLQALTMPGEKVVVMTPVYNCFFSSIRNSGCQVEESPLLKVEHDDQMTYRVDWQDFERRCADEKTTVFLLCNPHNPACRVWTRDELAKMAEICARHNVTVVSDEIHCELVMPGYEFTPFALSYLHSSNISKPQPPILGGNNPKFVICCSPSKSFNTAGLQMANIICPDSEMRRRIDRAVNINETCDVNPFAPLAVEAAYNEGEEWLDQLNLYIHENYKALCKFFSENLPQMKVYKLEGTYLAWVDVSATGLSTTELCEKLIKEGKVWVCNGTIYGEKDGEGFIRINMACQRERLMEGLRRIKKVLDSL